MSNPEFNVPQTSLTQPGADTGAGSDTQSNAGSGSGQWDSDAAAPASATREITHRLDLLQDRFEQLEFTLGQALRGRDDEDDSAVVVEALADLAAHVEAISLRLDGTGDETSATVLQRLDTLSERVQTLGQASASLNAPSSGDGDALRARMDAMAASQQALSEKFDNAVHALANPPAAELDLTAQMQSLAEQVVAQVRASQKTQPGDALLAQQANMLSRIAKEQATLRETMTTLAAARSQDDSSSQTQLVDTVNTLIAQQAQSAEAADARLSRLEQAIAAQDARLSESIGAQTLDPQTINAIAETMAGSLGQALTGSLTGNLSHTLAQKLGDHLAQAVAQANRPPDLSGLEAQLDGTLAAINHVGAHLGTESARQWQSIEDTRTVLRDSLRAIAEATPAKIEVPAPDLSELHSDAQATRSALAELRVVILEMTDGQKALAGTLQDAPSAEDAVRPLGARLDAIDTALRDLAARPAPDLSSLQAGSDATHTALNTLTETLAGLTDQSGEVAGILRSDQETSSEIQAVLDGLSTQVQALSEKPAPVIDMTLVQQGNARLMTALNTVYQQQDQTLNALSAQINRVLESLADSDGQAQLLGSIAGLGETIEHGFATTRDTLQILSEHAATAADQTDDGKTNPRVFGALDSFAKQHEALHGVMADRLDSLSHLVDTARRMDPVTKRLDTIETHMHGMLEQIEHKVDAVAQRPVPVPDFSAQRQAITRLAELLDAFSKHQDTVQSDVANRLDTLTEILRGLPSPQDSGPDSEALGAALSEAMRGVEAKLDLLVRRDPSGASPAGGLTGAQRQSLGRLQIALDGFAKRSAGMNNALHARLGQLESRLDALARDEDPQHGDGSVAARLEGKLEEIAQKPAAKPDVTALKRGFRALDRKLVQLNERLDDLSQGQFGAFAHEAMRRQAASTPAPSMEAPVETSDV